jgi:hypothetical protein
VRFVVVSAAGILVRLAVLCRWVTRMAPQASLCQFYITQPCPHLYDFIVDSKDGGSIFLWNLFIYLQGCTNASLLLIKNYW